MHPMYYLIGSQWLFKQSPASIELYCELVTLSFCTCQKEKETNFGKIWQKLKYFVVSRKRLGTGNDINAIEDKRFEAEA